MKSLLEVLNGSADYLAKNGIESPRLNAEYLLAHQLKRKRLDLYLEFDRPLGEAELTPLREALRERAKGKPLQHLLGSADFHGRSFRSDARGLIPRPETEHFVEMILKECGGSLYKGAVLDVGTGSGVIAITLAMEMPETEVTALDLSSEALALAGENAHAHGVSERIRWICCDLLSGVEEPFDWIIANLPYIPTAEICSLAREVQHDPVLALDGGQQGTELIELLILHARSRLKPGGRLALEIGQGQSEYLIAKLESAGYRNVEARADYSGVQRFLFATYG